MISDYKDGANKVVGKTVKVTSGTEYYIASNGAGVVHWGWVDKNHAMATGQPQLTTYETEQEWLAALALLDIAPAKKVLMEV